MAMLGAPIGTRCRKLPEPEHNLFPSTAFKTHQFHVTAVIPLEVQHLPTCPNIEAIGQVQTWHYTIFEGPLHDLGGRLWQLLKGGSMQHMNAALLPIRCFPAQYRSEMMDFLELAFCA